MDEWIMFRALVEILSRLGVIARFNSYCVIVRVENKNKKISPETK